MISVYPTASVTSRVATAHRFQGEVVRMRIGMVFALLLSRVVCQCTFVMRLCVHLLMNMELI